MICLGLHLRASLVELLLSLCAQGIGLVLRIVHNRPSCKDALSSLEWGSLWSWSWLYGVFCAPAKGNSRMETVMESSLGGKEERHVWRSEYHAVSFVNTERDIGNTKMPAFSKEGCFTKTRSLTRTVPYNSVLSDNLRQLQWGGRPQV